MAVMGQNTVSAEQLRAFVERVEVIDLQKKDLSDDRAAIMAEAKAAGYSTKMISLVVRRRKQKPHDLQEADAMRDMYLHALGMLIEPPLFRYASLAAIDISVREQVIERMREFVPAHGDGHIDVNWKGASLRLQRGKDGSVSMQDVVAPAKQPETKPSINTGRARDPIPDVDEAGAMLIGAQYARDNRAVIDNPFPFGDRRRAAFDEGWRAENGGDGMGPDDGKGGK